MVTGEAKFSAIVFAPLDGAPPRDTGLEPLPPAARILELVQHAFAPFCAEELAVQTLRDGPPAPVPEAGLVLVYVYGHAWISGGQAFVAPRHGGVEGADTLLDRLVPAGAADRTVLVFDCCHAAAFDAGWRFGRPAPRLVVYGSGAAESAIALPGENATRLALALGAVLARRQAAIDLTQAVAETAQRLGRDGVIRGQTVTYRMNGPAVTIARGKADGVVRREGATGLIRNLLLSGGAVLATLLILTGWFYWSHALVDIDLHDLPTQAKGVRVQAWQEEIATNGHRQFLSRPASSQHVRFWAPAADMIVRITAQYPDGAPRGLGFHLDLHPGFAPSTKSLALTIPAVAGLLSHPNMAFVPSTPWRHGQELALRRAGPAFWIDLAPPTVDAYLPIAEALNRSGQLKAENSFLLTALPRSAAIDAVGLGQVRKLNSDLGAIFGVIDASQSSNVSAPSDIVVGGGQMPCSHCPAVMTRFEAGMYCDSQGKRLPTDEEWELAVRGVDGRVYPWGDKFDSSRANVPGLPRKGAPTPALKPVDAYKDQLSPFGLTDTVGNAGDWVKSDGYERQYMGATYRFNPEDATAFRELPVTDDDYLVREITARCVVDARR